MRAKLLYTTILLINVLTCSTISTIADYQSGSHYEVSMLKVNQTTLTGLEKRSGSQLTWVLEDLGHGLDIGVQVDTISVSIGSENEISGLVPSYKLQMVVTCICISCNSQPFGQECSTTQPLETELRSGNQISVSHPDEGTTVTYKYQLLIEITGVLAIRNLDSVSISISGTKSERKTCKTTSGEKCHFPFALNGQVFTQCTTGSVPLCFVFDASEPGKTGQCTSCGEPSVSNAPLTISPTDVPTQAPGTPAPKDLNTVSLAMRIVGGLSIIFLGCCIGCGTLLWLDSGRNPPPESEGETEDHMPNHGDVGVYRQANLANSPFDPSEFQITVASLLDHVKETAEVPPNTSCCVCLESAEDDGNAAEKHTPYGGDIEAQTIPDDGTEPKSWAVLPCGHDMHYSCLRLWLLQRAGKKLVMTCPVCRAPLSEAISSQMAKEGDEGGEA